LVLAAEPATTPHRCIAKRENIDSGIALVPIDVRGVDFYGEPVVGALIEADDERQVYVPIRPICERLGIDWSGQYQRIKRDEVLNEALRTVRIERSESVGVTHTKSRRGDPNSLCLPLKLLPGFLFGVSTDRIKNKIIRERVVLFRRECYDCPKIDERRKTNVGMAALRPSSFVLRPSSFVSSPAAIFQLSRLYLSDQAGTAL